MTIVTRTTAKSYFETGDKPTQAQFGDLIDSTIFQEDVGSFGKILVSANTTASAQNLLGIPGINVPGSVGNIIFGATTTASAQQNMGGGTFGRNLFEAITTASGQNQIGSSTGATASTLALRDSNANLSNNNSLLGYTTTPTAAGTTTLTVSSTYLQYFTGTNTQTITLPVVSTLVTGFSFKIVNLSSGLVTVQSSGSNTLQTVGPNCVLNVICIATSGTGTASWSWATLSPSSKVTSSVAQGSPVSLTSGTIADVTSISLTAGKWRVYGAIGFTGNGGGVTGTLFQGFIGTATGNSSTGRDLAYNTYQGSTAPISTADIINSIPVTEITISATTTYYLKALASFTVGTVSAYGNITASFIS